MQKLKAIVIGATGATSKELVKKLLEDTDFRTQTNTPRKYQTEYYNNING